MLRRLLPLTQQPGATPLADHSRPPGSRVFGGCIPGVGSLAGGPSAIKTVAGVNTYGRGILGASGNYATATPAPRLPGRQGGGTSSSRDHTLVFVFSGLANGAWLYDGQSDGVGANFRIQKDSSGNLAASFGTSSFSFATSVVAVPIPSGPCVLIVNGGTYQGQLPMCWVNGVKYVGVTSTDSYYTAPAYSAFFGSSAAPTANYFSGVGNLAAVLRGNVTDAEAAAITANPWVIFQPRASGLWSPPPSAVGAVFSPFVALQSQSGAGSLDPQGTSSLALHGQSGFSGIDPFILRAYSTQAQSPSAALDAQALQTVGQHAMFALAAMSHPPILASAGQALSAVAALDPAALMAMAGQAALQFSALDASQLQASAQQASAGSAATQAQPAVTAASGQAQYAAAQAQAYPSIAAQAAQATLGAWALQQAILIQVFAGAQGVAGGAALLPQIIQAIQAQAFVSAAAMASAPRIGVFAGHGTAASASVAGRAAVSVAATQAQQAQSAVAPASVTVLARQSSSGSVLVKASPSIGANAWHGAYAAAAVVARPSVTASATQAQYGAGRLYVAYFFYGNDVAWSPVRARFSIANPRGRIAEVEERDRYITAGNRLH